MVRSPKQTGLHTNELRYKTTSDEAMFPKANKARNVPERAAIIRVVSKGKKDEDSECRCWGWGQPRMTEEQKASGPKQRSRGDGFIRWWRGDLTVQKH